MSHDPKEQRMSSTQIPRRCRSPQSPERIALVRWVAGLGAVTAEALAERLDVTTPSARARLLAAERQRLLERRRPLTDRPSLYAVTRSGLRVAGVSGLDPCRVCPSNALHAIECARVAATLERRYPDHRVQGERELRREERERGCVLASAELAVGGDGETLRHRPDLVLWSPGDDRSSPVAIEVELTVKAPERLEKICLAWARSRCVAGVLYLAPPQARRAVQRAIDRARAGEKVVALALDALPFGQ